MEQLTLLKMMQAGQLEMVQENLVRAVNHNNKYTQNNSSYVS
jgi:hypothetical protein